MCSGPNCHVCKFKKALKRWYYTTWFKLTRSDVCPKHWTINDRKSFKTKINHTLGMTSTVHTVECGTCEDERTAREEAAQQEAERRREHEKTSFEESLAQLRKAYLQ